MIQRRKVSNRGLDENGLSIVRLVEDNTRYKYRYLKYPLVETNVIVTLVTLL